MDKQNVTLKSQLVTQEFEVIGQGSMVYTPTQIGEWWVMPAEQYTGKIPDDIIKKWDDFKALNLPVVGYLIADDMREVLLRRAKEADEALERERKAEVERQAKAMQSREAEYQARIRQQQAEKQAEEAGKAVMAIVGGIAGIALIAATGGAILGVAAILAVLQFDPILIAVMPDGRWLCLGAWWD